MTPTRFPALYELLTGESSQQLADQIQRAHYLRDAAQVRYADAVARNDSRDRAAYAAQLLKATNRVLMLESGR